ncbi:MAG TPA: response regulator [Verrucomicrobiae bacterium]|nr:response regulator [Verrucomicrobiae bacterium]
MPVPANSLTILLVEDLEDDRYIFQRTLKKARPNVQLYIAEDGIEAIDYFQNQGRFANAQRFPRPDYMFLDLKMPALNGFDVLRWMKERSLVTSVNVIVLSGSSEPQDIALAHELGARDYIVKPITVELFNKFLPA